MNHERRAKIVGTIGPASRDRATLARLIDAGLDVARLNMSHGTHAEHAEVVAAIREISAERKRPVALLLDLSGAKIRLGELAKPVTLALGDEICLAPEGTDAPAGALPVRYPHLAEELAPGDRFSMMDGSIMLEATERGPAWVRARVIGGGGRVVSYKGLNLPKGGGALPSLTEKDAADLRFGIEQGFDWVSLSFVRSAADAEAPRAIMAEAGRTIPLMAKIEKPQALDDIERIVEAFDGLMVARGDLGIETELEDVPRIQKELIAHANRRAKPVITATQMLLSMVTNPRPTRAEVADVTSAVLDGTDAVMLSEETAMGEYPAEAVATIGRICARAEASRPPTFGRVRDDELPLDIPSGIARATRQLARLVGARLIITPTTGGGTARLISATRPPMPILALSSNAATIQRLALTWGVLPRAVEGVDDTDRLFEVSRREAIAAGLARPGDRAVVTAGVPFNVAGTTNLVEVMEI